MTLVAFTAKGGIDLFPAHEVLFCPFTTGHRDEIAPHLRGSVGDLPGSVTDGPSLLCVCGRRSAVSVGRGCQPAPRTAEKDEPGDKSEWGRGRAESVALSPQRRRKPEDRVAGWLPGGEEGLTWGDNLAGSPGGLALV